MLSKESRGRLGGSGRPGWRAEPHMKDSGKGGYWGGMWHYLDKMAAEGFRQADGTVHLVWLETPWTV